MRIRFSLRGSLIATAIVCSALGYMVKRAHDQRLAVAAVRQLGGRVVYSHEQRAGQLGFFSWETPSPTPAWLRDALGAGFFDRVSAVSFGCHGEASINDRQLQEVVPHLAALYLLKSFGLACGSISGESLAQLSQLDSLEYLLLDDLTAAPGQIDWIGDLKRLRELTIYGKEIASPWLRRLATLPRLESARLHGDWLDDDGIERLAEAPRLSALTIASDRVTDEGLKHLERLARLQSLSIHSTELSDAGMVHLGRLAALEQLELIVDSAKSGTATVTAAGIAELRHAPRLKSLTLGNITIGPEELQALRALPALEYLLLRNNTGASDEDVAELKQFQQLRYLEMLMSPASQAELHNALPMLNINAD